MTSYYAAFAQQRAPLASGRSGAGGACGGGCGVCGEAAEGSGGRPGGDVPDHRRAASAPPPRPHPAAPHTSRAATAGLGGGQGPPRGEGDGRPGDASALPAAEDPAAAAAASTGTFFPSRGTRELSGASGSFYERAKRLRNRDLRDQIRSQGDVGGILDLVFERGDLWDAVGVSTALHTAAWRCREGSARPDFECDARWHHLRELVRSKLVSGEARNLANNAWSLASMLCLDFPLLGEIAAGALGAASEFKAQEVSNTCWAFATAKWQDEPLFRRLAEEAMLKAPDGVNQDLTNTLWAFATVAVPHEPLFDFLCAHAVARVAEFKPQELANAIWALATTALKHDALSTRISRHAIDTLAEFRTQNLANFVWAYAKMAYNEEIVIRSVQAEALRKLDHFSVQDLSTAMWAFATVPHRDDRFLKRCVAAMRGRAQEQVLLPQHASNTLWALATVTYHDEACFKDLTAGAVRHFSAFKAQELSNIVWACASAGHRDQAFTDRAAKEVAERLGEFDPQGVGNSTWAVSILGTSIKDVYYRAWERLGEPACLLHCTDKVFSMLVAGFFRCGETELAWRLFDRVAMNRVNPGIAAIGMWLHRCRHRVPEHGKELRLMLLFAKHRPCRHLIVIVLNAVVMRLEELGDLGSARELLSRMETDGAGDVVTELLRERLGAVHGGGGGSSGASSAGYKLATLMDWRVPTRIRGNPRCDYDKECQVLRYVLNTARCGDPDSVVEAIERFSFEGNGWLKIAGDEKGIVLDDLVGTLAKSPPRLVLEFGCYVGYSATRFARLLRPHGGRVVSVEVDPVHVCIARSMLEFAGVADNVTVYLGYSEEAIPHLSETCRGLAAEVVFMDQRGTRFHIDLQALEDHGMLADGCSVAADNVLKPGAPHFLWHLQSSEQYDLTVVSLREFAAERIEDWIVVARYAPDGRPRPIVEFPEALSELAFKTDRVRQRSCAGDSPGEVGEDDWACHSQEVRRAYAAAGICPRVVNVERRADGSMYVDW